MSNFEAVKQDTANTYFFFTEADLVRSQGSLSAAALARYRCDMADLAEWPLESVTTKEYLPPGGDKHDYASLGTYWWPNPGTADGLPYVRRDGEINPEGLIRYDKDKIKRLAYAVYHLALLFVYTDDKRYFTRLCEHLQNWFIGDDTRMNPNLNYSQFIPGVTGGRGEGIIDYAGNFSAALNLLSLPRLKDALPPALLEGIVCWHRSFYTWLLTSPHGKSEKAAKNNHGTYYDLALCVIEGFIGVDSGGSAVTPEGFIENRLKAQIAPDGSLPLELTRTKSLSYTIMALKGLLEVARFKGVTHDPGLKKCAAWFRENALGTKPWPYQQITPVTDAMLAPLCRLLEEI